MLKKPQKLWNPQNWATWKPFGIGEQYPNNYWEVIRSALENIDELPLAWEILNKGVCDGCSLGTTGMKDWTLEGLHLCNVRLRLLRLNTMSAFNPEILADVTQLPIKNSTKLRELGRLPYPMMRDKGDKGFRRISWDEAIQVISDRLRHTNPQQTAYYLTSRGTVNETYYVTQKAVRAMGSNNIDNAARICHAPSTTALKSTIGATATTCSYKDWIGTDLLVFIGSNVANNQPVTVKYLHWAKKAGTKIVIINTYREPGMERYWVPSIPESVLFGTKFAEDFFLVNLGGDLAFLNGVVKHLINKNWIDHHFIKNYTANFEELKNNLETQTWEELELISGASREEMFTFAKMVNKAQKAVFVWSMGITQHERGVDNVKAIINLALIKGFVGREGCGLMPIRGHSGVQGGAEMGCYATVYPGCIPINNENAEKISKFWNFEVPTSKGLITSEMIEAAAKNELDVLVSVGGNFLEVLPDPNYVENALLNIPLRVHFDIILSSQMFLEPKETVILLPATTRYEIPGGVTETTTERRIIFSPEIVTERIGEARPEWQIFLEIARKVRPDLADKLHFENTEAIRQEIALINPQYAGIQNLKEKGDNFQYGGSHLCFGWNFTTPNQKANFSVLQPELKSLPDGQFFVATRRGKQFNSMVQENTDKITGAVRKAILMNKNDADRLNLKQGDQVLLKNEFGEYQGYIYLAAITPNNLQIHWPEGNVLLDKNKRSLASGIPDYNAIVFLEKI